MLSQVTQVTIDQMKQAQESGALVVDVRERFEYVAGHVPGAVHLPMATVPLRLEELTTDRPLYLVCESGNRSWQVAAFLARHGIEALNVAGGTAAWRASGYPLTTGENA